MIISNQLEQYIMQLIPEREPLLVEMEKVASKENVPIMELVGMEVLLQLLTFIEPKRILEVGTAIGYSAIRIAKTLPNAELITIERDEDRLKQAERFIAKSGCEDRIHVIHGDALELDNKVKAYGPFDCIFIDAAKGQYQRFFTIYSKYLSEKGVVISDNVLFRGHVAEDEIDNRRLKGMVRKLKDYNKWLMEHPSYMTTIYPVGDGIAVSRKR